MVVHSRETCSGWCEFEGLVQRAVAANAGIGFEGFVDLLATITERSLRALQPELGPGGAEVTGDAPAEAATEAPAAAIAPAPARSAEELAHLLDLQRAGAALSGVVQASCQAAQQHADWAARYAARRGCSGGSSFGLGCGSRLAPPAQAQPAGCMGEGSVPPPYEERASNLLAHICTVLRIYNTLTPFEMAG